MPTRARKTLPDDLTARSPRCAGYKCEPNPAGGENGRTKRGDRKPNGAPKIAGAPPTFEPARKFMQNPCMIIHFKKDLKKGIDKRPKLCYNTSTVKEGTTMSIEKLPDCYCVGEAVRIGWRIGTVLFRIGHYHLIWWNVSSPALV